MAGETTATTAIDAPYAGAEGTFLVPFTTSYSTSQNELNDVMEIGYLPANVTVYGFIYAPTDMDTNVSPALVHKVTVNGVDVVTSLTGGQTGTASWNVVTPTAVGTTPGTSPQLVTITSTTAAATAAAGTVTLALLCQHI